MTTLEIEQLNQSDKRETPELSEFENVFIDTLLNDEFSYMEALILLYDLYSNMGSISEQGLSYFGFDSFTADSIEGAFHTNVVFKANLDWTNYGVWAEQTAYAFQGLSIALMYGNPLEGYCDLREPTGFSSNDIYNSNSVWINSNGSIRWPDNDGFAGGKTNTTLQPGTRIDRFGAPTGRYVSPYGTPAEQRALAPGSEFTPYNSYTVNKPLPVISGTTAEWFGKTGGGTQYILPLPVNVLLEGGYIN